VAAASRSALAHWFLSAILTYYGAAVMRSCFGWATNPRLGAALALCGGLVLTYLSLLVVHWAIHTPHIALTLAAGVIPTILFCSTYAALLYRTFNCSP
jgi:hypothetical protein